MNVALPLQRTVYVTIFSNSEHSIQSFKNDFEPKNNYERLNKDLNADPNANYAILEDSITESMNAHLERKQSSLIERNTKIPLYDIFYHKICKS